MKATGIVRRIDDLGRVVIPKEIRRTQRIRVGDPLEIFVSGEGEVIFRKYSPIGELSEFAAQYAEVLSKNLGVTVLVCDRDHVVAAAGPGHRDCADKRVSPQVERMMENRRTYTHGGQSAQGMMPCDGAGRMILMGEPIVAGGDIAGAVLALTDDPARTPDGETEKAVRIAAAFLAKQMEG